MGDNRINIIISTVKRFQDGITGAIKGVQKIGQVVGRIGRTMFNVFKRLSMVGLTAFGALAFAVKKAFDFETAQLQLKVLLGSMAEAKDRFQELKDFSAKTPFELQNILEASRLLSVFSENAMGGADSLRLVGDAAAVAGRPLEEVAFWIGRAYSAIQSGRPFGEAAMRLQEMAILTAGGRNEIEKLTKSGAKSEAVWAAFTKELSRFSGGMDEMSRTGNGLFSTLKDNWTLAIATFGEVFSDLAKDNIRELIAWLTKLRTDGSIERWATNAKNVLEDVLAVVRALFEGGERRQIALGVIKDVGQDMGKKFVDLVLEKAFMIGRKIYEGFNPVSYLAGKAGSATAGIKTREQVRNTVIQTLRGSGVLKPGQAAMGYSQDLISQQTDLLMSNKQVMMSKSGIYVANKLGEIAANTGNTRTEVEKLKSL